MTKWHQFKDKLLKLRILTAVEIKEHLKGKSPYFRSCTIIATNLSCLIFFPYHNLFIKNLLCLSVLWSPAISSLTLPDNPSFKDYRVVYKMQMWMPSQPSSCLFDCWTLFVRAYYCSLWKWDRWWHLPLTTPTRG